MKRFLIYSISIFFVIIFVIFFFINKDNFTKNNPNALQQCAHIAPNIDTILNDKIKIALNSKIKVMSNATQASLTLAMYDILIIQETEGIANFDYCTGNYSGIWMPSFGETGNKSVLVWTYVDNKGNISRTHSVKLPKDNYPTNCIWYIFNTFDNQNSTPILTNINQDANELLIYINEEWEPIPHPPTSDFFTLINKKLLPPVYRRQYNLQKMLRSMDVKTKDFIQIYWKLIKFILEYGLYQLNADGIYTGCWRILKSDVNTVTWGYWDKSVNPNRTKTNYTMYTTVDMPSETTPLSCWTTTPIYSFIPTMPTYTPTPPTIGIYYGSNIGPCEGSKSCLSQSASYITQQLSYGYWMLF